MHADTRTLKFEHLGLAYGDSDYTAVIAIMH